VIKFIIDVFSLVNFPFLSRYIFACLSIWVW
jgi:hypothetical protein